MNLSKHNHAELGHPIDIISVYRYNHDGGMVMTLNSLLTQKKMTKYQLSKKSGVPQTTVIDIYGKPAPRSDGEDSGEAQFL